MAFSSASAYSSPSFSSMLVTLFIHTCVCVCANVCPMIIAVAILRALLLLPFLFLLFFSLPGGRLLPAATVDLCLYKLLLSVNVLLLCSSFVSLPVAAGRV